MENVEKIKEYLKKGREQKFSLDLPQINEQKKSHLERLMLEHGLKKEKLLLLPVDQGLEHGAVDFFTNPPSIDPEFQLKLAQEGDYSGIVFQIGLAKKYWAKSDYKKDVPLVLKLNGKTDIPAADKALSPLNATVKEAKLMGADAVGFTLYVGTPRQWEDFYTLMKVRQDCETHGLPLIVWAYPRGKYVEEKGGAGSLCMVAYAARVANELGADIAKINAPKKGNYDPNGKYAAYTELEKNLTEQEMLQWAVAAAGNTGVLISGGSKLSDEDVLNKAKLAFDAGVDGLIFGRNMWQRPYEEALEMTKQVKEILSK